MRQLNENQIFQYNGSPITFQKGDSVMVNATEMAKPFGKLAKDWLSNKSTKEFLSTLSAVRIIPLTGLVDKAFKKILFSFGSLRNCCIFVVLQVDRIIYLAEQAVKLLIFYMGIFYAHTLGYWRLPIRKLLCALRGRLSTCSSVYGNRFLFAYCLHK